MKISQTNVGIATHTKPRQDATGTGILPHQAVIISGTPTFRILGRVDSEAPWMEIRAPATAGWIESFAWCPFVALEITSGTGQVDLFIAEK